MHRLGKELDGIVCPSQHSELYNGCGSTSNGSQIGTKKSQRICPDCISQYNSRIVVVTTRRPSISCIIAIE